MENIDDLMRQKFDSDEPEARFEFQEEYWEQAMALLEQEEARKRRKWWWVFLSLCLVMALGAGIWLLDAPLKNTVQTQVVPAQEKHSEHSGEASSQIHSAPDFNKAQSENIGKNAQNTAQAQNQETQSVQQSNQNAANPKVSGGSTHDNNSSTAKHSEKGANTLTPKGNTTKKQTSGNKYSGSENKNGTHLAANPGTNEPGSSSANTPSSGKVSEKVQADVAAQTRQDVQAANGNTNSPGAAIASGVETGEKQTANDQADAGDAGNFSLLDIFNLPVKCTPLPQKGPYRPDGKHLTRPFKPSAPKPSQNQEKRLSAGLILAGAANKAPDTLSGWAGYTAGGWLDYRLKNNFSLSFGVQWRFIPDYGTPADIEHPKAVENFRYSFGYKLESWYWETDGLHQIELPVGLHWNYNRWAIGGGINTGMLFRVQNTLTHVTESSLEPTQKAVKKWVKGDQSAYRPIHFGAFADASFNITRRISLCAKAQYRFTPMFKTGIADAPSGGFGLVDFGLRFRIY